MPLRRMFLGSVLAWAIMSCVPWGAPALSDDLDSAWQFYLSELWGTPVVYGRDVVWTYGPWGFALFRQIHPKTFWLMIAIRSVLIVVALLGVHRLLLRKMANPWWPAILTFVAVNTLALTDNIDYLGFLMATAFLLLGLDVHVRAWREVTAVRTAGDDEAPMDRATEWLLHLLAASLAFLAVAKFTMLPVSAILVSAISLGAWRGSRRLAWVAATYVVAILSLWLAAGQPIGAFLDYASNSAEIARSFTEGLGAPMRLSLMLLFAGVLLGSWGLQAWVLRRCITKFHVWSCLIAFGLLLFAVFKAACVRHQGGNCPFFLLACPGLVALGTLTERRRLIRALAIALVAVGAVGADLMARERLDLSAARIFTMRLAQAQSVVTSVWTAISDPDSIRRRHASALEEYGKRVESARITGSVDIYPYDNFVPSAKGWLYQHRPIIQSYQACSIKLNKIDAAFFKRSDAPEWVLYRLATIDERFPTIDEPLMLDVLLQDYTPQNIVRPNYTQLRHTPGARTMELSAPARLETRLGEWVTLPPQWAEQRLRCSINFDHSLAGKAAGFLWQYPQVRLQVRYVNGQVGEYRLPQELARAGFILSPVPQTSVELFSLVDDAWRLAMNDRRVTAMRVVPTRGNEDEWAFAPQVSVQLQAFRFVPGATSQPAASQPAGQATQ